ncbi:metallophosphatase domain-containing protein [Flavobacterium sp.]|uniref:metallophosphatase domain-containing protein n=1 Tax=Flavobacterium sp. TaxID=239 RepID=UPI0040470A5B
MQFTLISDTHGLHNKLTLQGGDILIHAGDVSVRGTESEVLDFLNWFKKQPYTYKIFIAGNHDWFFEKESQEYIKSIIPKDVIYLNDSGVCIEGVNIWGSPIQPTFFNWAFNRARGKEIDAHWQLIPNNTDILITHGPPFGVLDKIIKGQTVGCEMLLDKVREIKPKLHVFGHIHEAYGLHKHEEVTYSNASVLNVKYLCVNQPIDWVFK